FSDALDVYHDGDIAAAFAGLDDEVRTAGQHSRRGAVLGEHSYRLLHRSRCNVIECLHSSSFRPRGARPPVRPQWWAGEILTATRTRFISAPIPAAVRSPYGNGDGWLRLVGSQHQVTNWSQTCPLNSPMR